MVRFDPLFACALVSLAVVGGCSNKGKEPEKATETSAKPVASASSTPPASPSASAPVAASASADAPQGEPLPADASGALVGSWKIAPAAYPKMNVSLVVGDKTVTLPALDATADGPEDGKVAACAMKRSAATQSRLECGGTPHYNYFTAKLANGALVVTLTDGVDENPGSEKVTVVATRPTTATALKLTGPASPALYGNCRAGFVQRTAESPCLRQCLKGTGCKPTEKCELTAVTGLDGPHKVSACVPAK